MNKTIVLITIDTEFSTHKDDLGIFGRINGKEYGLPHLVQLLDQYGLKGTFFVDVYTDKKPYVKNLIDLGRTMKNVGHDLELHTHPNGLFDPRRGSMQDYTLSEQIEIIKQGKKIFREWFGHDPIAHRAGDWGANEDTLKALIENGITLDSSMFYGWDSCRLNWNLPTKNRLVVYNSLLEVPASVFHCRGLGLFSPFRLLSTDGNSLEETLDVLKQFQLHQIPVVTVVYHSFSFLRWNKERTEYRVDFNRLRKFEDFMKFLAREHSLKVLTVEELYASWSKNKDRFTAPEDFIPQTGIKKTLRRLWEKVTL